MFFGNLQQDWSEFVLTDLGVFQYEKVAFAPSSRAFQQRADVDVYLALHACREALEWLPTGDAESEAIDELVAAIAAIETSNPVARNTSRETVVSYRPALRASTELARRARCL